jgi:hypothetical protein
MPESEQSLVPKNASVPCIDIEKDSSKTVGPATVVAPKYLVAHVFDAKSFLASCHEEQE